MLQINCIFALKPHVVFKGQTNYQLRRKTKQKEANKYWVNETQNNKFWRITRPRSATRKKLGNRLLLGYEYRAKSGVIRVNIRV